MFDLVKLCTNSGIFMAARPEYRTSSLVILGAPMDITSSFRPGSRDGPQAIRLISPALEEYSLTSRKDLRDINFHDAGDLLLPVGDAGSSLAIIQAAVSGILSDGKFPLLLGGEHLISLPSIRAAYRYFPDLAVIHIDAHADLRHESLR